MGYQHPPRVPNFSFCYDKKTMAEETKLGEIIIYKNPDGPEIFLKLQDETLWLTIQQMADLFQRDKSVISRHLKAIFKEGELSPKSTVAKIATVQNEGGRSVERELEYYNLDAIISVGYRVNSKRGTQFRIWATKKLRDFLLKGYIIDEKRLCETQENRLKELQRAHLFIKEALEAKRLAGYEKELASIINDYTQTWAILNRYDEGDLELAKESRKNIKNLDYARAKRAVEHFRERLMEQDQVSGGFGRERGSLLSELLLDLEKKPLGLEEKAATLFYSIIKNRPFVDGNKRIASLLFVVFLIENNFLYDKKGERKFNDNALIALALLVEETKPSEKETLIQLIANLTIKK